MVAAGDRIRMIETSRIFIAYIEHVRKVHATKYWGLRSAPEIIEFPANLAGSRKSVLKKAVVMWPSHAIRLFFGAGG